MAENNGFEISDEMLQSIAGGKLDEVSIHNLKAIVGGCKKNGMSLEEVYNLLAYLKHDPAWEEMNVIIAETYAQA